jgi:hypothetical protein
MTSFASLNLPPPVLANLQQLGYLAMTPIQAMSLPPALAGKDLIAQAETGSGKTAAFGWHFWPSSTRAGLLCRHWCCAQHVNWRTR